MLVCVVWVVYLCAYVVCSVPKCYVLHMSFCLVILDIFFF